MTRHHATSTLAWASCGVVASLVTACTSAAGSVNPVAKTAAVTAPIAQLAAPSVSPLSGRPAPAGKPVLVVKVDNVAGAFPQAGLNNADLIYVEEVEGGLTRLTAVFSSRIPRMIGPVRSARTDNIQLLTQFGRPTIAYSGANNLVLRAVRRSILRSGDANAVPGPFRRRADRPAPHNLFLTNVPALLRARPASTAVDVGLTFAAQTPGGRPARRLTMRYSHANLQFDYDPRTKRWLLTQDGRPHRLIDGSRVSADTVIVENIRQRHDINGYITPFNQTIGHGKVSVLRNGRVFNGTWRRPTVDVGTRYQDAQGNDIPLRPGVTWVFLVASDAKARVG